MSDSTGVRSDNDAGVIMRVLVSAASKHGSTAEIAVRIADTLRTALPDNAVVDVCAAGAVTDVTPYDAMVVGSAVYMGRWLDDARGLAARVAEHAPWPVWLFSSGPIGEPSKPDGDPAEVAALVVATGARGHCLFSGRLDRHLLGFAERAMVAALRVADGDFRDWDSIDGWGRQIAAELCAPAEVTRASA